ncbi:Vesicle-associated membrane protein-associated protein [Dirofilaria immitis]
MHEKALFDIPSSETVSDAIKTAVSHEELIKKMEGLKFNIEPDFVYVDNAEEMINFHKITNENLFPIIFRIKVTHPSDFRVNPVSGIIGAKQTLTLKIKRFGIAFRSDRFDIEVLPYIEELLNINKLITQIPLKYRIQWFFSFGYIPIISSIRYKQVEPWDTIFPALDDPDNLKISPRLSQICKETGITSDEKEYLTLNEFIILDAAITRNETDFVH